MTKYADSWKKVFTCSATGTQYSVATTVPKDWWDVSWANELYSFVTFAETGTANSEVIDITIERYQPFVTASATAVVANAQLNAAGSNEAFASAHTYDGNAAIGADQKIGTKIRLKCVAGGTFGSGNVITVTCIVQAKRV